MLLSLIVTGVLIANRVTIASPTDAGAHQQEDFAISPPERLEKKSFASFRFRPKGLKDLDTLEDAYKVMDQLHHITQKSLMESVQRRGQAGHHSQMIPQYEGKSRVRNLLEKAWMRALLKSNIDE